MNISPNPLNPLQQNITGLGGAGGATIVAGEIEAIAYIGSPSALPAADDDLTVTTGVQNDTVRLDGGIQFDAVTSSSLPTIAFTGVDDFVLDVGFGIDIATVNPSFLLNAVTYQVQSSISDTVNFEGAQDADLWTITHPAGVDLLLTDNTVAHSAPR